MPAVVASPKPKILVPPMQGEKQDRYVERADRALRRKIVDRNSRMGQIFQDWRNSGAESELQQRAESALAAIAECDPSQIGQHFVIRRNRPIFPEHEVTTRNGDVERYDRAALGAIVDRCNRRILETGDLAAMSAGHTPDRQQQAQGMPMPAMVGLMGPFRLGMIGADAQKWCIFADEAVFKDDWPAVQKMPRRSAEVWMEPNMADRAMDPIAVLGSETPRLDTGVSRFSRRLDPARFHNVTRYSMDGGAASFPSGSNTYTEKYSQAEESNMDQAAIQEIVSAVMQGITATPQWQYLTDQMQAEQNPIPENEDTGPAPGEVAPAVTDPSSPTGDPKDQAKPPVAEAPATNPPATDPPAGGPPAEPAKDAAPASDPPKPEGEAEPAEQPAADASPSGQPSPEELASMGDDERAEFGKMTPDQQAGYMVARRRHCKPGNSMQQSDSPDRAKYSRMESEHRQLQGEVQALRADRTYRERYSKLVELSQTFDFDPAEEIEDCRSLKDAEFDRHIKRIEKYSRHDPNGGMPTLHLEPLEQPESLEDVKKEKYSRRAVQIAGDRGVSWNEAMALAKTEIDKAG